MAELTAFAVEQAHQAAIKANQIAELLNDLEDIKEHLAGASIDLATFATVIAANENTQHAEATDYKVFINEVIPGLVTHMISGSSTSGNSYWNWMQIVRKIG